MTNGLSPGAAVREVPPGKPSALREFVRRPPPRAQIIRRLAADLGARFQREVWAYHRPGAGWEIDWETVAGTPTRRDVAAAKSRQRQYDRDRRRRRVNPNRSLAMGRLWTLTDVVARRLPEPVLPAHLALAYRQEFRVPPQIEWLPRLGARWGCGRPSRPRAHPDQVFCRNACRQRAYDGRVATFIPARQLKLT